jgi:hypothetical protein
MPETLEKVKKILSKPELYFTDQRALQEAEREMSTVLRLGNELLRLFNRFYSIESIGEFAKLVSNPFEFYKVKHKTVHSDEFERFERIGAELAVKKPEGFQEVEQAARKIKGRFENNSRNFVIKDGSFTLSQAYYDRLNSRCHLHAKSVEEKRRLQICQRVIDSLKDIEEEFAREYGVKSWAKEALTRKLYAFPLPWVLKIAPVNGTLEIIPNRQYIEEHFGGSSHLGINIPTRHEQERLKKRSNLGQKWVKFYRMMRTGKEILYTCEASKYDKIKNPIDRLVPGFFNELGEPYGTPIDLSKTRKAPEVTVWSPIK